MRHLLRISAWILLVLGVTRVGLAENLLDRDMAAIQQMRAKAEADRREEELKKPKVPQIAKDRAVLGNRKAPVMIVAYSDFQCPYCRQGADSVEAVRKKYGSKVAFIFKHFPLPDHPMALPAALRFEAIALQSSKKAYQFHDAIFKEQQKLSVEGEAFLDGIATTLKVDVAKMKKDMGTDQVKKRLMEDTAEAQKFGFQGTPGFLVGGVSVMGAVPPSEFEPIIEARLKDRKVASAPAK